MKVHVALQKRSFQIDGALYLGRSKHAWIVGCLQHAVGRPIDIKKYIYTNK